MTDNLILYEPQKIHETLSKTKEEHTLNFRMIKPTEKFNFSDLLLNSSKLGLIRLSVYNYVFNVNRRNNQFLHEGEVLVVIPGAYELIKIADIIKEETNGNVIIEPDKNTMKCKMEVLRGAFNFDVENSVASILGFDKQIYSRGKYTTNKIIDIMGINTIIIHCNIISRAKDNGKDTDISYTFNLTEPLGYLIINRTTMVT